MLMTCGQIRTSHSDHDSAPHVSGIVSACIKQDVRGDEAQHGLSRRDMFGAGIGIGVAAVSGIWADPVLAATISKVKLPLHL